MKLQRDRSSRGVIFVDVLDEAVPEFQPHGAYLFVAYAVLDEGDLYIERSNRERRGFDFRGQEYGAQEIFVVVGPAILAIIQITQFLLKRVVLLRALSELALMAKVFLRKFSRKCFSVL